jgi:hypothetical protein
MIKYFFLCLTSFYFTCVYSIPGKIIGYDAITNIPIMPLDSLDIKNFEILNIFNVEHLPSTSGWQKHSDYYTNRNRTVYATKDRAFVLKVWQKGYPATNNFLSALHAHFYEEIALIAGLVFDNENECRGYISPYMIDRTGHRSEWDSYGIVLEKGDIGVKIFSNYAIQPSLYQDFLTA